MPLASAATTLRQTLKDPNGFVIAPGVYDGLSARLALAAGFDALYMTGAGTAASVHGQADLGICTLNDMRTNAEMIANLSPSTPLICDADTGYGGPIMVSRTTEQYARSGVAAFHIEDQVQTKRCAAVQARNRLGSDIVVIARTDSLQGHGYEEALTRLRAARDAGADAVKDLAPWPLLLNMVEHGSTPSITAQEAREIGFKIIIFPFATIGPALTAMAEGLEKLKKLGLPGLDESLTPQALFRACGLDESVKLDAEAGGVSFEGGVDLRK
ncbi:Carboxyvinyl-carboxyphosphonate phosphorylmutase [Penicillium maclennaniae]|uniref:Carboxyvinyl-carboxyphosphonate phosphorylmutase n=1 Tax=Penicillium maclennaniae TaxID=1343394 RepID=UPI00254118D8|nr:Carboxyvinyl-carboxyphosphonate phosphorylmutase [Penicillium maclennaniae]KAJ5684329.1 Carboxyvinyl-carboxyphosphonate phosphorylmutase [Penicillium maclennaniae]